MSRINWWEEDNMRCAFNDHVSCMELGLCENCEHYPANKEASSQLDTVKQITIEEIINGRDKIL